MKATVTLIVPCYNEEESLPIFYNAVCDVARQLPDYGISLLLVNDGSKDGTLKVMRELAARDERVQYLSFSRNFGKEAAMYAGFCNAKGDYVAMMDADLQDPPALLPQMLDALLEDIRPLVERLPAGVLRAVATQRILEGIPCGIISRRMHFSRCYVYRLLDQACDRLCQMEEARLGLKKNEK